MKAIKFSRYLFVLFSFLFLFDIQLFSLTRRDFRLVSKTPKDVCIDQFGYYPKNSFVKSIFAQSDVEIPKSSLEKKLEESVMAKVEDTKVPDSTVNVPAEEKKETPKENGPKVENVSSQSEPQVAIKEEDDKAEEDDEGPDTMQLSDEQIGFRGNWVKKREWLERTIKQNKKIDILLTQIEEKRAPIWKSFESVQDEFDKFYRFAGNVESRLELEFGLKAVEAKEAAKRALELAKASVKNETWMQKVSNKLWNVWSKIKNLFVTTSKESKKEIKKQDLAQSVTDTTLTMSPTEAAPIATNQEAAKKEEEKKQEPSELDQFRNNLKIIKDFDDAIVKRFEKLDEEFSIIVNEVKRAKSLQNEMWDMIDDMKARANFYEIKVITKKVRSIKEYIEGDFISDFDSVVENSRKRMEKIKERVATLEQDGIIPKSEEFSSFIEKKLNLMDTPTVSSSMDSTSTDKAEINAKKIVKKEEKSFWRHWFGWLGF
ncbi:TPA: hypothetical protein DEO28_01055 [Candidatus Dependentiae bacterium]|nr:MAG: hypothetical protein UR14_C0003G0063 [candidate division TM6 bacterium GW2011_GWE2_31_21]KKP53773.1 MAG: hypothetical protein UR43_C0003G0094 [candidate division TM6 bacterium GW2011_GWF2_33_332]HBS48473.1 hypothetical protein [Candidatus Dependentiae bacterium]HBZ73088.1 hypothetical protein [Candidatus Dependentiae bacterium]